MAVPVLRWLLDRLVMVDALIKTGRGRALEAPTRNLVQSAASR